MKRIDLETHFLTEDWVDAMYDTPFYPRLMDDPVSGKRRLHYWPEVFEPHGDALLDRLLDLGEGRIQAMDAAGVDVAVLSLAAPGTDHFGPGVGTELARSVNDQLAAAVAKYPDRLQGFACLAPKDAEAAAKELERAVRELGLKGWKTHSNFIDSYLDEKRYWPVLAKAEELGVPIYLHPTAPLMAQLRSHGLALAGAGFGFGMETAATMLRLVLSGVFDAFPRLQVILGHYGEGLPFLLQRVDHAYVRPHIKAADPEVAPDLALLPSEYLHRHLLVTTSGNYLPAAFHCTREALGPDKIMLGTDYPFEEMDEAVSFIEALGLSREDREHLYYANARALGFG